MSDSEQLYAEIPLELAGLRLDQALAGLFPDFSRSKLQSWIKDGHVLLDGVVQNQKRKVLGGEQVELCAEIHLDTLCEPEDIPLEILFEDESVRELNEGDYHKGLQRTSQILARKS